MRITGNPANNGAGFGALLWLVSFARGTLALVGFLAIAVAVHPSSRDWIVRHVVAFGQIAVEPAGAVSAEGAIVSEDSPTAREQRVLTEFIAKRFRVAEQAVATYVAAAYRAGAAHKVDPALILAVAAVESRFNPVAESVFGAKGLMQIIPKFHHDKLAPHGGSDALLDPEVNIEVGTQILREYLRRFGDLEGALQVYAGAADEVAAQYASKVVAERSRIEQALLRSRRT